MASKTPTDIDPKDLERAETLWVNFGVASKWGIILVIATLVLLAVAFL